MNKATRIQKIEEITTRDTNPFGIQEILWEDALNPMPVHKIPLEYLTYNKYNGRILSRTKSLESQNHEIDSESESGKKQIEQLLYNSNIGRNKQTLESIKKYGQEKIGIITKDGIIIDGNRRAMLLRMAGLDYFKAVVLPVTLEQDPIAIEKLETSYQMGEDEKLGYNPIEKYLKAKGLRARGITTDKIADWMGEAKSIIEDYLAVMNTMNEYLSYLEYEGIYTQLDGREDQFINLTKWLSTFYTGDSSKAFDGYKKSDVDDLKIISFDYIRAQYEGKKFRFIADGLKENHFFGDKNIWADFLDFHFKHIKPIQDVEEAINYDSANLEAHLNARDAKFLEKTQNGHGETFLNENIDTHYTQLRYKQAAGEPMKLVNNAMKALDAIDQRHKAFSKPEVLEQIKVLNHTTNTMLSEKSPKRLLSQIIELLNLIKLKSETDSKDELLEKIKNIERIAYRLEKDITRL